MFFKNIRNEGILHLSLTLLKQQWDTDRFIFLSGSHAPAWEREVQFYIKKGEKGSHLKYSILTLNPA